MSGESAGLPPLKYETIPGTRGALAVQADKALILREQLELYIEAAIALRDILEFVGRSPVPQQIVSPEQLYAAANRVKRMVEIQRRAIAILEQLGLGPKP